MAMLPLGWGAASAAAPQRAVFRVALTGTLTKSWTSHQVVEGQPCNEVTRTSGVWRLSLHTSRPTRIVALRPSGPGRPVRLPLATVRSIAGTATHTGSRRVQNSGNRCGANQSVDCARKRIAFRGATARLTSPTRRLLRFGRLQGIRSARLLGGTCPREPGDIRFIQTELTLADAPVDVRDVFDRGVGQFYVTASTEQETTLEGDYDGRVIERVRWRLTFTRAG